MRRNLIHAGPATFLLLVAGSAHAAYWVEAVSGPPGSCQLVRGGQTGELKVLMLLHDRDRITLADGCAVVLSGASNEHTRLTAEDSPFEVPAGDPAPTALENIADWAVGWYNTQSRQQVSLVSAVTRGGPISLVPVLIEAASTDTNKILMGTHSVVVRWTGGTPPYAITLVDAQNQVVATASSAPADDAPGAVHGAALKLPELQLGNYQIRVQDEDSVDSIRMTVVPESEEPENAAMLRTRNAPENIRQSYRAIVLASQPEWRFQALQIAAANNLEPILERLIMADFPEAPAAAPTGGQPGER